MYYFPLKILIGQGFLFFINYSIIDDNIMSKFIHLHTHSHYSLLNALPQLKELVKTTKELGMKSLALTDAGNMYGTIEFYQICKKNDIKPIIGVDFYVA